MKDSGGPTRGSQFEDSRPEVAERLLRRSTEPIGIIDLRQAQQTHNRLARWVEQRFPLLDYLKARYAGYQEAAVDGSFIFAGPDQPLGKIRSTPSSTVVPSRQSRQPAPNLPGTPVTPLHSSTSVSESSSALGQQVRVRRSIARPPLGQAVENPRTEPGKAVTRRPDTSTPASPSQPEPVKSEVSDVPRITNEVPVGGVHPNVPGQPDRNVALQPETAAAQQDASSLVPISTIRTVPAAIVERSGILPSRGVSPANDVRVSAREIRLVPKLLQLRRQYEQKDSTTGKPVETREPPGLAPSASVASSAPATLLIAPPLAASNAAATVSEDVVRPPDRPVGADERGGVPANPAASGPAKNVRVSAREIRLEPKLLQLRRQYELKDSTTGKPVETRELPELPPSASAARLNVSPSAASNAPAASEHVVRPADRRPIVADERGGVPGNPAPSGIVGPESNLSMSGVIEIASRRLVESSPSGDLGTPGVSAVVADLIGPPLPGLPLVQRQPGALHTESQEEQVHGLVRTKPLVQDNPVLDEHRPGAFLEASPYRARALRGHPSSTEKGNLAVVHPIMPSPRAPLVQEQPVADQRTAIKAAERPVEDPALAKSRDPEPSGSAKSTIPSTADLPLVQLTPAVPPDDVHPAIQPPVDLTLVQRQTAKEGRGVEIAPDGADETQGSLVADTAVVAATAASPAIPSSSLPAVQGQADAAQRAVPTIATPASAVTVGADAVGHQTARAVPIHGASSAASKPAMVWRRVADVLSVHTAMRQAARPSDSAFSLINGTATQPEAHISRHSAVSDSAGPGVLAGAPPSAEEGVSTAPTNQIDIARLAEQVSRLLTRQLAIERDRRGRNE